MKRRHIASISSADRIPYAFGHGLAGWGGRNSDHRIGLINKSNRRRRDGRILSASRSFGEGVDVLEGLSANIDAHSADWVTQLPLKYGSNEQWSQAAASSPFGWNGHPAKPSTVTNSRGLTLNVVIAFFLLLALENRDVGRKQCQPQD